jgi:hypothetical protein
MFFRPHPPTTPGTGFFGARSTGVLFREGSRVSSSENCPENTYRIPREMLVELVFDMLGIDSDLEAIPYTFDQLHAFIMLHANMAPEDASLVACQFMRRLP